MSFQPCSSCACHIKVGDGRCPFCGAVNTRRRARRAPAGRMSRAQWLAFGSVALVGCVGTVAESSGDGGGAVAQHDAGNTPAHDGGNQAQPPEAGVETGTPWETGSSQDAGTTLADAGVACSTRSGYFDCSGNVCDRSIQACQNGYCEWYGALGTWQLPDAASCGPCPTCACLQGSLSTTCHCTEDGQGTISISCGGCYGSPPARLERLLA